jgi:2-polyprenyl-3-methyl-5-hydroxy-6-metoxy-1,4-benzoquinol methylase
MPEYVNCNLCGADDTRPIYALRDYRLRVDDRLWNLVQCRRCSLGYLNPRPTIEEIGRYYPGTYFGRRGGMTRRYSVQAEYLPEPPGDLLDIGAARGDFMEFVRRRGWNVTGIEPWTTENPHDLPIVHARFPEHCHLGSESFDVITAWAVFEHLHDPRSAFVEAARLLRPTGELIVQVPNFRSINSRYARFEDVPRHLTFFSPATLRRYATIAGLEVSAVHHTTNLHGGSGRGVLQLALTIGARGTVDDFFDFYRLHRRERFRARPVFAAVWTGVGAIERAVVNDWLVRSLRISGQIVVSMRVRSGDRRSAADRRHDGDLGVDAGV